MYTNDPGIQRENKEPFIQAHSSGTASKNIASSGCLAQYVKLRKYEELKTHLRVVKTTNSSKMN